ncbi:MAG: hypothetical protein BWX51_01300 [Bacteroidetes bacterium ADurb.Bin012]|mgnify:CR=1 FL=1|jgi:hypothetical protein|nr:MAG: hypothetical protein BWX51_01300 [Bacteroidetes bacterium ADurb.Bin012]
MQFKWFTYKWIIINSLIFKICIHMIGGGYINLDSSKTYIKDKLIVFKELSIMNSYNNCNIFIFHVYLENSILPTMLTNY